MMDGTRGDQARPGKTETGEASGPKQNWGEYCCCSWSTILDELIKKSPR